MFETNKVFIRSIIIDDRSATSALFANRVISSLLAFGVVSLFFAVQSLRNSGETGLIYLCIAAISVVLYPTDSYLSLLQARGRFNILFLSELIKYGAALVSFLIVWRMTKSVSDALLAQLVAMAVCQIVYFSVAVRTFVNLRQFKSIRTVVRSPAARQARLLSVGNLFPASLEHVDKILVGWVFGLELLGVYTLAYSTGRFVYNSLKPAMYIYYRRFVDEMPGWRLLRLVGAVFTFFGLVSACVFQTAIRLIPELHPFRSGATATSILFLSYGVGIVSAVYGQAFALNKESDARHFFTASLIATMGSCVLLAVALTSRWMVALPLLALQYPVRDGLTTWLMSHYRSQKGSRQIDE